MTSCDLNDDSWAADWETAQERAVFLAFETGKVHKVKSEPPSAEWPLRRWVVTKAYVVARQTLRKAKTLEQRIAQAVGSHVPSVLL